MAETNELENGGFSVDIKLTELCQNYLIENISKIMMPKGINIIPITWDINKVGEYCGDIQKYIILLLEEIQKSDLKDLKYNNNDNDNNNDNYITLETNNKKVNMNFNDVIFDSDDLIKKIITMVKVIAEETNSKNATYTPICKLPLFILLIDSDKPCGGKLCKLNNIKTILGIVHEMVIDRFE
tara:strand:- start:658 stop:1206 length:549 start_codon:yes stop_codon:yes gene_type:complete